MADTMHGSSDAAENLDESKSNIENKSQSDGHHSNAPALSEDDKKKKDELDKKVADAEKRKIHWSEENEDILVEWCDVAQCYKWLHATAHASYKSKNAWYTIPAIILSTISGTASFAQTSLPTDYQVYSPMVIGGINIFIGILTTVQQYLKIAELNEGHRVSSISWDKYARNIRIELAKTPDERLDAGAFIKMCRQEFDRLMETSPMIPEKTVKQFTSKFRGSSVEDKEIYKNLRKPDICDKIETVNKTRHKWYIKARAEREEQELREKAAKNNIGAVIEQTGVDLDDLREKEMLIENQQKIIKYAEELLQKKKKEDEEQSTRLLNHLEVLNKKKVEDAEYNNKQLAIIQRYIDLFQKEYERLPLKNEIEDNVRDEVDPTILKNFLDKYADDSMV